MTSIVDKSHQKMEADGIRRQIVVFANFRNEVEDFSNRLKACPDLKGHESHSLPVALFRLKAVVIAARKANCSGLAHSGRLKCAWASRRQMLLLRNEFGCHLQMVHAALNSLAGKVNGRVGDAGKGRCNDGMRDMTHNLGRRHWHFARRHEEH